MLPPPSLQGSGQLQGECGVGAITLEDQFIFIVCCTHNHVDTEACDPAKAQMEKEDGFQGPNK